MGLKPINKQYIYIYVCVCVCVYLCGSRKVIGRFNPLNGNIGCLFAFAISRFVCLFVYVIASSLVDGVCVLFLAVGMGVLCNDGN